MRALTSALAQDLETAPPRPVSELHDAMTRHSVGLLAFALAHRGTSGTLPAVQDIDEQTRFYWLDDKNVRGHTTKRMVWISDMTAKQLSLYDRHVRDLEKMLPEMAPDIRAIRQQPGLPLFSMKQGKVEPISVKTAIGDVMGTQNLRKNSGRHWLRAQLVGQCSTETLHAFYGHGPLNSGSWDFASTLDPALYRADLARMLDPSLKAAGWAPRSANLRGATL